MRPIAILLLALSGPLFAQEPQVDTDEIYRRGNMVVRTGEHESADDAVVTEALSPPADDSGKWFVVIFSQRGCAPCEQLKRDWNSSPELQAWARPGDPKQSWAHYTEFRTDDGSQLFRKQRYKIQSTPYRS